MAAVLLGRPEQVLISGFTKTDAKTQLVTKSKSVTQLLQFIGHP